jgi:hypothetical protein
MARPLLFLLNLMPDAMIRTPLVPLLSYVLGLYYIALLPAASLQNVETNRIIPLAIPIIIYYYLWGGAESLGICSSP